MAARSVTLAGGGTSHAEEHHPSGGSQVLDVMRVLVDRGPETGGFDSTGHEHPE